MLRSNQGPRFSVDAPSSIVAGLPVAPAPVDRDTLRVLRVDLGKRAGPCTQPGPAPAALPDPADVPASARRAQVSALALALAHLDQAPRVPAA
jgi:hypothetical protein